MSIKDVIASQYHASLAMLRQAVIECPDALWDDREYKNWFWHVVYHALVHVHLYLQPSEEDFIPWAKHRDACSDLRRKPVGEPYSRDDMLEYHEICRQEVDEQVALLALDAPSGFPWLPFNKLELQFYTIRHLQQHVGELCERLGVTAGVDVDWVAMRRE